MKRFQALNKHKIGIQKKPAMIEAYPYVVKSKFVSHLRKTNQEKSQPTPHSIIGDCQSDAGKL